MCLSRGNSRCLKESIIGIIEFFSWRVSHPHNIRFLDDGFLTCGCPRDINAVSEGAKVMETSVKQHYSRVAGLLMFGIGAAFAAFAFNVYRTGQSFDDKLLLIVPFGLFYG